MVFQPKTIYALTLILFCSKLCTAIIGGHPSPHFPFFALVQKGGDTCGGTLLGFRVVLTSARCLFFHTENRWAHPNEVNVLHGDLSRTNSWKLRYHSCEKLIVHFKYERLSIGVRSPFDVALIKLEDKVRVRRSTLPICRFDGVKAHSAIGVAVGLGLTGLNPPKSAERLMETIVGKVDCYTIRTDENIYPMEQCYRFQGGSSIAEGDFGGPIIVQEEGSGMCLIGAMSFTTYCRVNKYSASIVAPADKLRHWINRVYRDNFTNKFSDA